MKESLFKQDLSLIAEIREGIERESLRTDLQGKMSRKRHPICLGEKLTHPFITTDYSENLLEFITGVHSSTDSLLDELTRIHAYTHQCMDEEIMWPSSMPSILPEKDDDIPLAYFGESNIGKLKTLYRKGLGNRYGRAMQSISGLHYNFSLSDNFWNLLKENFNDERNLEEIKSDYYFRLIRNFQRYKWVLIYLFGATPVVHKSFLHNREHKLEPLGNDDFYSPFGMSLRMGGLGYTSSAQDGIHLCYNHVKTYIKTLEKARRTSFDVYEKIGLKRDGEFQQLNTHLLQIDNEFYSTIRPKNIAKSRESALMALNNRGVEYVEVRLLDIDPFSPVGISKETIYFLHLFLIWCLESDSPELSSTDLDRLKDNFVKVVTEGRNPELKIVTDKGDEKLNDVLKSIFKDIKNYADHFSDWDSFYQTAFDKQVIKIEDPDNTLASKVLAFQKGRGFQQKNLELGKEYHHQMRKMNFDKTLFDEAKSESIIAEKKLRDCEKLNFNDFLVEYFENIKIDMSEE